MTECVYLGGVITENGRCMKDIKRRIGLASAMFGTMSKMEVEQYNNINVKIYGAYVIPVIVYGSECWCLRKEDERRILVVEMNWLQIILGRFRRDKIWNEATRKELGQEITSIGRQNQEKKACVAQTRKKEWRARDYHS